MLCHGRAGEARLADDFVAVDDVGESSTAKLRTNSSRSLRSGLADAPPSFQRVRAVGDRAAGPQRRGDQRRLGQFLLGGARLFCLFGMDLDAVRALRRQCPYCIEIHSKKAKKAGATEQELAETTLVAAALRAGGAVTHGTHTLE